MGAFPFVISPRAFPGPHSESEGESRPLFSPRLRNRGQERRKQMGRACKSLDEVVFDILRIVDDDKTASCGQDQGAEYFFRGEQRNYGHPESPVLDTRFDSCLDGEETFWKHERELYEEAMRLNVASFHEDRTMCERIARMRNDGKGQLLIDKMM